VEHRFVSASAIPLPWPSGFRSETLRPPLSVEFALFGGYVFLIGIFTKNLKFFGLVYRSGFGEFPKTGRRPGSYKSAPGE
jgi:hypothetical protein